MIEVCLDTQHSQTNTWQYLSNAKDMKYAQHDTIQCLALTLIVATFKECLTSTAFESCRPSWTNYFRIVNTHTLPLLISHKGRYSATQQGNDHRRLRGRKHHDNHYVFWRVLSKVSQPVSYVKPSILPMPQNILFVWNTLTTTISNLPTHDLASQEPICQRSNYQLPNRYHYISSLEIKSQSFRTFSEQHEV